jgi:hypothetical protein
MMRFVFGYFEFQVANLLGSSWTALLIFSPLFFQSRGSRTSKMTVDVSLSQVFSVSLDILDTRAEALSGADAQPMMPKKISTENKTRKIVHCLKDICYTITFRAK